MSIFGRFVSQLVSSFHICWLRKKGTLIAGSATISTCHTPGSSVAISFSDLWTYAQSSNPHSVKVTHRNVPKLSQLTATLGKVIVQHQDSRGRVDSTVGLEFNNLKKKWPYLRSCASRLGLIPDSCLCTSDLELGYQHCQKELTNQTVTHPFEF